jgi:hypothetical protein
MAFSSGGVFNNAPPIFSKRNARSLAEIVSIHAVFLTILLWLIQFADYIEPSLPEWATDPIGSGSRRLSVLEIVLILTMVGVHFIERRWLYVEIETAAPDVEDKTSESSRFKRK